MGRKNELTNFRTTFRTAFRMVLRLGYAGDSVLAIRTRVLPRRVPGWRPFSPRKSPRVPT